MANTNQTFKDFLPTAFLNGVYQTDDVIAFLMPLIKEVASFHEAGLVAPFERSDSLFITNHVLDIDENFAHPPKQNLAALDKLLQPQTSKSFNVVDKLQVSTNLKNDHRSTTSLQIHLNINEPFQHPVYVLGYRCFEELMGHHDVLTDIFCLGLIIGSMSLSLDLYDADDLEKFVQHRNNPVQLNARLHPAISSLITEMTELDRNKRSSDLYSIIQQLEHYRDYDPEKTTDLSEIAGFSNQTINTREHFILKKLRDRLFDFSRRNRLLYYKSNMRFVNLTVGSVPMVLHHQSINPEQLFIWSTEISKKVKELKEISLNKYLRFEDHPYLIPSLDKIKSEAQKDKQEFGFSRLRLVVAFLQWHNLKEDKNERIVSPLLLLPVELKKKKAVNNDQYTLEILDNEAEINPVLANYLKEIYGLKLPGFIDLTAIGLEKLYINIKQQLDETKSGIKLNYINKPRIKLIHTIAKQTVGAFKKKLRKNRGLESFRNIEYSYQPENYKPLGLEIFRQRIKPSPSTLELLVNDDINLSVGNLQGEGCNQRELFTMADAESNPFSWDFDICNMVLGNFNYKKMSLVSDYNTVIDNQLKHQVFSKLFGNQPKIPTVKKETEKPKVADWYHVITADPTQTNAILQGRTQESYIIQGPPGTGKSQTITNLIADFVARGKSILFVCEKRAALDVVYYRLKQQKLDELCCYIHDSQGDKREFIKNLKATYEDYLKDGLNLADIILKRNIQTQRLQQQLEQLENYHQTSNKSTAETGVAIRKLVEKLLQIKTDIPQLSEADKSKLPHYNDWMAYGEVIVQLSKALEETGAEPELATHSLRFLSAGILEQEHPQTQLQQAIKQSEQWITQLQEIIKKYNIAADKSSLLKQLRELILDSVLLRPLAENDNLELVKKQNEKAKKFDKAIADYQQKQKTAKQAEEANQHWQQKFTEQDLSNALPIADKNESAFFSFLNGSWRKLKKEINASYNFSAHQVKPSYTSILQQLKAEYDAQHDVANTSENLKQQYHIDNIEMVWLGIERLRSKLGDEEVEYLLAHPQSNELVLQLSQLQNNLYQLETMLSKSFSFDENTSLAEMQDLLDSMAMNTNALQELLPALQAFSKLPVHVQQAFRQIALTPTQAEAAMANKTWNHVLQTQKSYASTDSQLLDLIVKDIAESYKALLSLNADFIRGNIRKQFLAHYELSNKPANALSEEEKIFKKQYAEGRQILEHEFAKQMRYKSIRELAGKESGIVLKDLKPVWLMSPLSVSDTMPVDKPYFDVIIFDEASQITLEEGIPALYRAPQSIIVGDEMQMPPTNFFSAKAEDADDLETFTTDGETEESFTTDADSLLTQGARKLDAVMLGWHYRSRYETLIIYSNHAFYNKNLLTIPDRTIHHQTKNEIVVSAAENAAYNVDFLFDRSISFHFYPTAIYEKRSNIAQANYIAFLVKSLLKKTAHLPKEEKSPERGTPSVDRGQSIGIVAFSQEQQHVIEDALESLANADKDFAQQLEKEYDREEDGQFVGLFVKNLENVQGDERDIIIMSECYGPDANGKMIMNFGPINKKGGEKRLNVIFSRAKKHMAIVSSIKHEQITNEYNEGANFFKQFLQYAEMVSTGNMAMARIILDALVGKKTTETQSQASHIVALQLKNILEQKGYTTDLQVGQSNFRSSLAVKKHAADEAYELSILIDDDGHYANDNLLEIYFQRPAILKSFGWKVVQVLVKDWLLKPKEVVDHIEKVLLAKEEEKPIVKAGQQAGFEPEHLASPIILMDEPEQINKNEWPHNSFERYESIKDNKFWEIKTEGKRLLIHFGRVGTQGQTQVKTFADIDSAEKEKQKLVEEKLTTGYVKL